MVTMERALRSFEDSIDPVLRVAMPGVWLILADTRFFHEFAS